MRAIKTTLCALLFAVCAPAFGQITSDGPVTFEEGSILAYNEPEISVSVTVTRVGTVNIVMHVYKVSDEILANYQISAPKADIDALTGSGDTETNTFLNAVYLYVKDYLEGITENSGVTFTIL